MYNIICEEKNKCYCVGYLYLDFFKAYNWKFLIYVRGGNYIDYIGFVILI